MKTLIAMTAALICTGCAGGRAVDTTRLAEAMFAGEKDVTYTVVPGSLAGMPSGAIAIPTVPGKDVRFRATHPNGLTIELDTSRSAVTEAALLGLSQVDAAKFAADAATREWMMQIIDRAIAIAQPLIAQRMQQSPTTGDRATLRQTLADAIKAEMPSIIAELKGGDR